MFEDVISEQLQAEKTNDNKYLSFQIGNEEYAIDIKHIKEIVGLQNITDIPDMPAFVKGVINLRGKVIPLIDVRLRFGKSEREYDERTCIIITKIKDLTVGFIVDTVKEVLDIPTEQIDSPPKINKNIESRFIKGLGRIGDDIKIIIDVYKLLFDEELEIISEM